MEQHCHKIRMGTRMKDTFTRVAQMALVLLMATACQTVQTTSGGTVGVSRQQSMLISAKEIEQASAQKYNEVIQEARQENRLNRHPTQLQRVRRITSYLVEHTSIFRPDARNWAWEVNVISSEQVNAWCMAGGKMAVYSGLLDQLALSDDELAAVMGHEMAHALREHSREQVSRAMATGIGVSLVGAVLGVGQIGGELMSTLARVTFELPNSRLHETEADRIGVELSARAGYNPMAALSLWEKMSRVGGGQPPQWLSTHPSFQTRQSELRQAAERVMPLYEAADRH
jgi:predicted Zn-dependent protease